MDDIFEDRISKILENCNQEKLSSSEIYSINERINKEMNESKLIFNKREQDSIEAASKIILNS